MERLVWTADLRDRFDRFREMLERNRSSDEPHKTMDGKGDITVRSCETNVYAVIQLLHHTNSCVRRVVVNYIGSHASAARSLTEDALRPDAKACKWGGGPEWCNDGVNFLLERSFFDSDYRVRYTALHAYGEESNPGSNDRISKLASTQGTNQIAMELWTYVYQRSTNMVPAKMIPLVQARIWQKRVQEAKVYFRTGIGGWIPHDIMLELNKLFDADMAAMGIPIEEFETCRNYAIISARLNSGETVPPISPEEEVKRSEFMKAWTVFKSKNTVNIP